MTRFFVDWAHDTDKIVFFDGMKTMKRVSFKNGDELYGENLPFKYYRKIAAKGVQYFRVHQNLIANYRKQQGLEKTDELDARLIHEYWKTHPGDFKHYTGEPKLKLLYETFKEFQKVRVATGNREWAAGEDENDGHVMKDMEALENGIKKDLLRELESHLIWKEWLKNIKGINVATASGLIAFIGDIGRFELPSALASYAGLKTENGIAPKKRKGTSISHHPRLKSLLLGVIADSFIKQRTPLYRDIYDNTKQTELAKIYPIGHLKEHYNGYEETDTKLLLGHAHNRAMRKTAKIFLEHYWVIDRQLHGLKTRPPYPFEYLGHTNYIPPPHIPERLKPFKPY